jgi:hypothetical protein
MRTIFKEVGKHKKRHTAVLNMSLLSVTACLALESLNIHEAATYSSSQEFQLFKTVSGGEA